MRSCTELHLFTQSPSPHDAVVLCTLPKALWWWHRMPRCDSQRLLIAAVAYVLATVVVVVDASAGASSSTTTLSYSHSNTNPSSSLSTESSSNTRPTLSSSSSAVVTVLTASSSKSMTPSRSMSATTRSMSVVGSSSGTATRTAWVSRWSASLTATRSASSRSTSPSTSKTKSLVSRTALRSVSKSPAATPTRSWSITAGHSMSSSVRFLTKTFSSDTTLTSTATFGSATLVETLTSKIPTRSTTATRTLSVSASRVTPTLTSSHRLTPPPTATPSQSTSPLATRSTSVSPQTSVSKFSWTPSQTPTSTGPTKSADLTPSNETLSITETVTITNTTTPPPTLTPTVAITGDVSQTLTESISSERPSGTASESDEVTPPRTTTDTEALTRSVETLTVGTFTQTFTFVVPSSSESATFATPTLAQPPPGLTADAVVVSNHMVRLTGANWDALLLKEQVGIIEAVKAAARSDIARALALNESQVVVRDVAAGSLIVHFTVSRFGFQFIRSDDINRVVLNATFNGTSTLYRAAGFTDVSTTTPLSVATLSAMPVPDVPCSNTCVVALVSVLACVVVGAMAAVATWLYLRRVRRKRAERRRQRAARRYEARFGHAPFPWYAAAQEEEQKNDEGSAQSDDDATSTTSTASRDESQLSTTVGSTDHSGAQHGEEGGTEEESSRAREGKKVRGPPRIAFRAPPTHHYQHRDGVPQPNFFGLGAETTTSLDDGDGNDTKEEPPNLELTPAHSFVGSATEVVHEFMQTSSLSSGERRDATSCAHQGSAEPAGLSRWLDTPLRTPWVRSSSTLAVHHQLSLMVSATAEEEEQQH